MSRARVTHRCGQCGWTTPRWVGRCGQCQTWGSIAVDPEGAPDRVRPQATAARPGTPAVPIRDVDLTEATAVPTGIDEFDRVLGGGLVPGSVVLMAGEPGIGKSTLLLEVAARTARPEAPVLYLTGEESAAQVRLRAERVGAVADALYLAAATDLSAVLGHVEALSPSMLVVDSIQTIASGEIDGSPGGVTQVRHVAGALIEMAKRRGMAVILVGHVTKDGAIAGPRTLEHLVDVVISVDGERHGRLRLVRAVKNRYGPADEVGCFELAEDGIWAMPDPSGLFLTRRTEPVSGTCVTVTSEGSRPLLAEVQSLVASGPLRRTTSGVNAGRVSMVLAVLERRAGLKLIETDLYVATVAGVQLVEPSADLAIALAVTSAVDNVPLPLRLVALGEVGLGGELRRVGGVARRLAEAARMGYTHAIVPRDSGPVPDTIRVRECDSVTEALQVGCPQRR